MIFAKAWIPGPVPAENISHTVHLYLDSPINVGTAVDIVKERAAGRTNIFFRPQNVFHVVANNKPWGNTPEQLYNFLVASRDGYVLEYFNAHIDWWTEFFARLFIEDIYPLNIILDNETSFSPWGLGRMFGFDNLSQFYLDYASALAPDYEFTFQGRYWGMSEDDLEAISLATKDPISQILRRLFKTLPNIMFNTQVSVSNYNDHYPDNSKILTRSQNWSDNGNTWRLIPGGIGNLQAPELYVTSGGNRFPTDMSPAERRWENLLTNLNNLQSIRFHGGPIQPWVAPIGYGATKPIDELTRQELSAEAKVWELILSLYADVGVEIIHLWNWKYNDVPYGRSSTLYEQMDKILGRIETNYNPSLPAAVPTGLDVIKTDNMEVSKEIFMRLCV